MTREELRLICDSLDPGGQSKLARMLNVDPRTIRRKLSGASRISRADELAILKAVEMVVDRGGGCPPPEEGDFPVSSMLSAQALRPGSTAAEWGDGRRVIVSIVQPGCPSSPAQGGLRMSRLIFPALAVSMLSGCSVLERVDMTIQRLDTANHQLAVANQQIAIANRQSVESQALMAESNRLVVESQRQMAASIEQVAQSNGKIDVSNANMEATLAEMEASRAGIARSNALMTEMNEKMGTMIQTLQKIPGLNPQ
ncbi:hypothetical protein [Tautonia plasticadhaerens]|nr:hypothetical protein [Tautonia plasticadhaerens]